MARNTEMLNRREFMKAAGLFALGSYGCVRQTSTPASTLINDVHAQLNPTRVNRIERVDSFEAVRRVILKAKREGRAISIAGGRHAMGGQQFGTDTVLVDASRLNRVLSFEADKGLVAVEAGILWPQLIDHLLRVQQGRRPQWGIIQKQTGGDRFSLGGSLAANIHGRGLGLKPFIEDVESFVLVDADGNARTCSRMENPQLFNLVIGGYGVLGIVVAITLRLAPRRKVERVVQVIEVEELMPAFERRIAAGYVFGDFQYATDGSSDDFLRKGVFSCYRPVDEATPVPEGQREFSEEDWRRLLFLSHTDKKRAFAEYAGHYRVTSGQIYWSDTHQLSVYIDNYHEWLDRRLGATDRATEMITEIYVPRPALTRFLEDVRQDFRQHRVDLIYGTIRLIERDDESFLAWARQSYACIIFNLHVVHTPQGLERAARDFRRLIDLAISYGGSYYLTYHRWATRKQVESCYPRFPAFLRLKKAYDPEERFQSDWYRHYRNMFADVL
jgi:FAD/FMN-containing dehydrogenase